MNSKDPVMAWSTQLLGPALLPEQFWTAVTWIAFFFKLVSLAFFIPIAGLIIFDILLWAYSSIRPSRRRKSQPPPSIIVTSPTGLASYATTPGLPRADKGIASNSASSVEQRKGYAVEIDG